MIHKYSLYSNILISFSSSYRPGKQIKLAEYISTICTEGSLTARRDVMSHLLIYLLPSSEEDVGSQKISFIFYYNINLRA